jgi:hypothetical protein
MTGFLALFGSVTKDDIRHNRSNVGERLGFLGRLIHGLNPRGWLKELKLRFGEADTTPRRNSSIEEFGGVRGADSKVDEICRDADQGIDDCLWRIQSLKLPSIHPKISYSGQRCRKDHFLILLILLGVVGLRFLALCQGQITNRQFYH